MRLDSSRRDRSTKPKDTNWSYAMRAIATRHASRAMQAHARTLAVPSWADKDPEKLEGDLVCNLVGGEWKLPPGCVFEEVQDPLDGKSMLRVPLTRGKAIQEYAERMHQVPKHGMHNPKKNPERYLMYGDITARLVGEMRKPEVADYFSKLIQRVSPKSYVQAMGEVSVTTRFLENFCGDQVRFLARSFGVPGDHNGQYSNGYRWPYGPVAIITPFNFPLEIPVLQLMGALYMGNRPVLKVDSKVSVVMEQMLKLMQYCGVPGEDVDFINTGGAEMNELLMTGNPRTVLFTGSKRVAEKLSADLHGRLSVEDAGFDWKVLGPDVPKTEKEIEYVSYVCDQDAYACSGQKCSAQSLLFMHKEWTKDGVNLEDRLSKLASRRELSNLTIGPTLTVTNERIYSHIEKLLKIPGARLVFGGKEIPGHTIPREYGAMLPTAVFVPIDQMLASEDNFELVTTEIFGPFQILTEYGDDDVPKILQIFEKMDAHLTAGVVSSDPLFVDNFVGHTVNGTTYIGLRARTTGAPQNHWFGPAGDPRAAGIGTPEAIQKVWSSHREVISDVGPIAADWTLPAAS